MAFVFQDFCQYSDVFSVGLRLESREIEWALLSVRWSNDLWEVTPNPSCGGQDLNRGYFSVSLWRFCCDLCECQCFLRLLLIEALTTGEFQEPPFSREAGSRSAVSYSSSCPAEESMQ